MSLRRRLAVFALPLVLGLACAESHSDRQITIGVNFTMPQTLLDGVESMRLYVADATDATQCAEETGIVSSDLTAQGAAQTFDLRRGTTQAPCPDNSVFCSDEVTLPTDGARQLVFQVIGLASNNPYAVGCTTQAVNSNPFYVHLVVHRFLPPASCGNGTVEVGEQCEPPAGDASCDDKCRTKEILLSNANPAPPSAPKVTNTKSKNKKGVQLAWTAGGAFHAVFQDNEFTQTGPEINYRQMTADLQAVTSPALLAGQIRLPLENTETNYGFVERPFTQAAPSITLMADGRFFVAYEDSRQSQTSLTNISMTPVSGDAKTPGADEVYLDTTANAKDAAPSIASGPSGLALVVWTDTTAGAIRGRIWDTSKGWIAAPLTIAASGSSQPRVAGSGGGWKVVWHGASTDGDDILSSDVSAAANVTAAQVVNTKTAGVQNQPAVAFTPNGESIVVWNDGGSIMMQRFDKANVKIADDQKDPVNPGGAGDNPSVTGSSLVGGFFAIAWQSGADIRARFADVASGYLFNPEDGQDGSFVVNYPDSGSSGPRMLPAVAVGGNSYVGFAWQDESAGHFGIYARRFPLPIR
ncbi:MAG: hypothetical protein HY898_02020 [Deltaproteobacteria bacterium]|nr:hypothetical protein [Deltaproteobacteria bacterium]